MNWRYYPVLLIFYLLLSNFGNAQVGLQSFVIDSSIFTGFRDSIAYYISDDALFFWDEEAEYQLEDILEEKAQPLFQPYSPEFSKRFSSGITWIRFRLENTHPYSIRFFLFVPGDRMHLYELDGADPVSEKSAGPALPIGQWDLWRGNPPLFDPYVFQMFMGPGASKDFLLRSGPHYLQYHDQSEVLFYPENAYRTESVVAGSFQWIFQALVTGMLFMFVLFSLFTYAFNRDVTYLFYALYIAAIGYYFLIPLHLDRLWIWGKECH